MAHFLFIATSALTFAYFAYKCRQVDIYLVAAASGMLFFAGAYVGEVDGPRGYPPLPVPPVLYYSFSLYLAATLLSACAKDSLSRPIGPSGRRLVTSRRIAMTALTVWGLCAACLLAMYPHLVFSGSKRDFMSAAGFHQTLLLSLSTLAATCLLTSRLRWRFTITALILVFSVLTGSRTVAALTIVACTLIYGQRIAPISLLRRRPLLLPVAVVLLLALGIITKHAYSAYRGAGIGGVQERFATIPFSEMVSGGAEFLSTQYIFSDMVQYGFSTDGEHILRGPLSLLPIPRSWYTTGSNEFNQLFQPVLYGDIRGGMAYNPFAEFYTAAGFPGVVVFIVAMQAALYCVDHWLRDPRWRSWAPVLAIAGALIAFYIHRNSVAVTCAMIRNVAWPYVVVLFICRLGVKWSIRPSGVSASMQPGPRCRPDNFAAGVSLPASLVTARAVALAKEQRLPIRLLDCERNPL